MKALELSDKHWKNILNIVTIVFAIFLFIKAFFIDTDKKRFEESIKNIEEENFQGYVIGKGFERFNHNALMIYLSNNTKFAVFGQFWAEIKIGDSVVKKKGETIITVYRNKEKFVLDNKEIIYSWEK
ncbi:hypothetical protein [Flavobacterium sp. FlaQc-47]|uniref:hypothetical protein n=1 Tax=Flavobacterium sp. FlaQc-47 TaxID=3374180 RepID=UPI00375717E6